VNPETPIVFIVDDDRDVRDSLRRLLTSVGLIAEVFDTAQAFLTARRPDAPSCLVLDVRLPGLSGLDLQRELAAADISLPIIFLTGDQSLEL
jgi:FixJ family two-component response regulator